MRRKKTHPLVHKAEYITDDSFCFKMKLGKNEGYIFKKSVSLITVKKEGIEKNCAITIGHFKFDMVL